MGNTVDFNEEIHCKSLIASMTEGHSFCHWCAREAKIGKTKGYEWLKKHPAFKEAHERGYLLGLAYYEDLLHCAAVGIVPEKFKDMGSFKLNVGAIVFTLKTRFYREYSESQQQLQVTHVSDERPLRDVSDNDLIDKLKLVLK